MSSMSNRTTNIIAAFLLLFVFLISILSIKDDSLTFDETAHIAAGYSYLTQRDYRLNPEHPPLLKDLAAFPLLFLNLNFPKNHSSWLQEDNPVWWHQFDFGSQFLYKSGNNPDQILFWSRMPMILLLVFFGWFLFYWSKKLFGNKTGLLTLFLFSFSPTFLAHGRLVTTDVGAAFGVVISTFFWLKFLKNPNIKNIIFAGLIFGIAMILKFSLILLLPFFGLITIIYAWLNAERKPLFNALKYLGLAFLVGIIGLVFVVWPVYQYHVSNYPIERQLRDSKFLLSTTPLPKPLTDFNCWLVTNPVLRPFGQYLLGLLLAINRTTSGNTTYFLGEISAAGWPSYFPIVYLIKESLAFHILTLIALLYAVCPPPLFKKKNLTGQIRQKVVRGWVKNHFPEFSMLVFIGIYWITSLTSSLNIGVRHLLPVFPFTILLVSAVTANWLKLPYLKLKYIFLIGLLLWQVISIIAIYPHFLAYFNKIAGGPDQGYLFAVDSNLDWGQDLKRLEKWLENPPAGGKIDKIYLDYFGGGNPEYYLKEKFAPWWGKRSPEELPKGSYLAVSATQLQGGRAKAVKGFDQSSDYYRWLDVYRPIKKIGYSIFVYYVD